MIFKTQFALTIILLTTMNSVILFDFNNDSNLNNWRIVDDAVMGGISSSQIRLNAEGHGVFEGEVSTKNNGGFSSVRYTFEKTKVSAEDKIIVRLKGDGKDYQLRVKNNSSNYYSYIKSFSTTGKWEDIEISLKDMYPSFRGRQLDSPNFSHNVIEEIVFLIGNKKNESFQLQIDKIELK